eukprot:3437680-Pleurochrysis_carterae.AAC.1
MVAAFFTMMEEGIGAMTVLLGSFTAHALLEAAWAVLASTVLATAPTKALSLTTPSRRGRGQQ